MLFQRLAQPADLRDPRAARAERDLARNRRGQSALWKYGISGDLPDRARPLRRRAISALFRELLQAHEYWR